MELDRKNIEIPEYQRTYDWSKNVIDQLLECLEEHRNEHENKLQTEPYFLGNLMIHSEDDKWYLVDGQQRLVTLTLIAASVRDLLIEMGHYKEAFALQTQIIGDLHSENRFVTPRDTEEANSPQQLLMPIQVPSSLNIEYCTITNGLYYGLSFGGLSGGNIINCNFINTNFGLKLFDESTAILLL